MRLLKILLKAGRYTTGAFLLLAGIIGVGLASYNPTVFLPQLSSYLPLQIAGVLGTFIVTEALLRGLLSTFYGDPIIWGTTAGVSGVVIILALILLVQSPKRAVRAIFHSPITFYKKALVCRNWLLEKIDYLNGESEKWRRIFMVLRSPYSLLRTMGFSPQMAVSFLVAGSAVGSGVVVNETILAERSFSRGDSGTYTAPLDVPTEYVEGSNTLRIDLGSTPVRAITIENVSVGTVFTGSALPSGEQNVVQISGNTISGGTNTRLEIGHLIFEKSRCKKLELSDIQAHTLIVRYNSSDGHSLAPSPGTARMRAIGGGHHQAEEMLTSGGTYDRIWLQAPTSGVNGKVGTLTLSNLYTKGGQCVLSKMNVGTLEILLNEIGMGDGFATKEFTIATNVTAANMTIEDNVEVTIAEPATQ